jgi:hypothetical protein
MNLPASGYSFKAPDRGFKPAPEGVHQAVIFQFAWLGYQDGGKYRPKQKIAFNFMLAPDEDGNSATVIHQINPSAHARGSLTPFLKAVTGNSKLTDVEVKAFDFGALLGAPATISVVHKTSASGKTIAKVDKIIPAIGDGWKSIVPADYAFYIPGLSEEQDAAELAKLPPFIQTLIATQLSEVQYKQKLLAYDKENPKESDKA